MSLVSARKVAMRRPSSRTAFSGLGQVVLRRARVGDRRQRLADVDGDDVGALLSEPDGLGPPLPPGRPRDECHLVLESLRHSETSLCSLQPLPEAGRLRPSSIIVEAREPFRSRRPVYLRPGSP